MQTVQEGQPGPLTIALQGQEETKKPLKEGSKEEVLLVV